MPDPFFSLRTIGEGSPYQTRLLIGRFRLHIFHRGDGDLDPHDHPWSFWTFPLTSYIEEITSLDARGQPSRSLQTVKAFRLHYRPATHLHRVIGRSPGGWFYPTKIITLVWRGPGGRAWGFLKTRDGSTCWESWKTYIRGGRTVACAPVEASHPDYPSVPISEQR